jgi:hypothetical protein
LLLLDMAPHLRHHKQNNAQSPAVVLARRQRSGAQHLDDSATLTARRIRTDHTAAAHGIMRPSRVARQRDLLYGIVPIYSGMSLVVAL